MSELNLSNQSVGFVVGNNSAYTTPVYPFRAVGASRTVPPPPFPGPFTATAQVRDCQQDSCAGFTTFIGVSDGSVYEQGATANATEGKLISLQIGSAVQVELAEAVLPGNLLVRQILGDGKAALDTTTVPGFERNRPYFGVALESGDAGEIIWAMLIGSFRERRVP
jgi:hypothetical protein